MIAVGKRVSSFSGLFNGIVNGAFRALSDQDIKDAMEDAFTAYNAGATASTKQGVGEAFGLLFKRVFEMEVPNYQYKDYTKQN